MQYPSNLIRTSVGLTTAVANVAVSTFILAAPGANLRYRLWAASFVRFATVEAAAQWYAAINNAANNATWAEMSSGTFQGGYIPISGGIAIPTNEGMRFTMISSLVGLQASGRVYYTIEAV